MSVTVLRRRYQRLLAVYPSDWRAANETVVLDTLLEAAGPTRRWPSLRETLALLAGGVRAWIRHRPDPGDRGQHWLEGLQLGAILLALGAVAIAGGPLVSWLGHGLRDVSAEGPAYDGSSAAFDAVWLVMAAVTFVSLLRGRVRVALVATAVWVPGFVLAQWAFPGASEGTGVRDPAMLALGAMVLALPLLAILAVLVWRGCAASLLGVAAAARGADDLVRVGAAGVVAGRDRDDGRTGRRAAFGGRDR
jgi:hypothetical protein